VQLSASATSYDGSTVTSYSWSQIAADDDATPIVPVQISNPAIANPTITLPNAESYKTKLVALLKYPDRAEVLPINPHALEEAETAILKLTVTTSSGTYTDTVNITANLGLSVTTGLRNIGLGVPQLLQAASKAGSPAAPVSSYNWTLTTKPGGSNATLKDPTSRWPILVTDLTGGYVVTESVTGASFDFSAGRWQGAITGLDGNGRPLTDNCTNCHAEGGLAAAAAYFESWRKSGHAEIFAQNINQVGHHWTTAGCASCHTVGYDTIATAKNDGFDDYVASSGWTPPAGAATNYASMFNAATSDLRKLATLANVQCENCHGPNGSIAHANTAKRPQRVSLSAGLCSACHGEPLRHGRFQQWQLSGHSNYDLALEEATVESRAPSGTSAGAGHCGRCHSAQGFINWVAGGDLTQYIQGADKTPGTWATAAELTAMGLTNASVHPQTCATCHEAHQQGTTSSEPNTATVRLDGDLGMTPAGFEAPGVGHGAICIACHNTRNGAHNDLVVPSATFTTPHAPSQGDVLMGENAYFVAPGSRGPHSYITNTCTNCHMQLTPPPELLSYSQTGTNHSFKAEMTICANCHGDFDGGTLQTVMEKSMSKVLAKVQDGIKARMNAASTVWVRARNATTGAYSSSSATSSNVMIDTVANPIKTVTLSGSTATVTLTTPLSDTWSTPGTPISLPTFTVALSALKVDNGTQTAAGTGLVVATTTNLYRAIWNYSLVSNDGSKGVHNPSFVRDVLNATLNKDLAQ
jgi:hypothetical protein